MSEANRTFLAFIKETTAGTTPSTGNFKKIPFTAAPDFSFNPSTVQSAEIRADRQIDDLPLVGIEAGGSVEIEFAYGKFDELILGALFNSWKELDSAEGSDVDSIAADTLTFESSFVIPDQFKQGAIVLFENAGQDEDTYTLGVKSGQNFSVAGLASVTSLSSDIKLTVVGMETDATNYTISTASKTIEIDDATAKAVMDELAPESGDWIALNTNTTAQRGFYRVVSVASSGTVYTITYDIFVGAEDEEFSVAANATSNYLYVCRSIKNGTTSKSYSILQAFQSLKPELHSVFSGCKIGSFVLNFDTQAIITGSLSFLGLNSRFLPAVIPANRIQENVSEDILNSSSNVAQILIDGSPVTSPNYIQAGSLNIENNVRRQNAVGSVGSVGLPAGTNVITGGLTTYFGSKALAEDVINNTEKSYLLRLTDKKKRRFFVDVPRLKFSSGSVGIAGTNTDLVLPLEYQALRHGTLGYQLKFCAFPFV